LIGVDAYFPIAPDTPTPTYDQLRAAWIPISQNLKRLSEKYNKHLIFTEIGYPSQHGSNVKPNKWDINVATNYTIQSICYKAFFEGMAVEHSDWFKGVFWWAWWTDPLAGLDYSNLYTPQNKPVLEVLREYYNNQSRPIFPKERNDSGAAEYYWCGVTQS
jgi:hypothetical protein